MILARENPLMMWNIWRVGFDNYAPWSKGIVQWNFEYQSNMAEALEKRVRRKFASKRRDCGNK